MIPEGIAFYTKGDVLDLFILFLYGEIKSAFESLRGREIY